MGAASLRMHFAKALKALRENAGLSQGELGDVLGCSRGSISFYEQMQRVPDIEILKNICKHFGVSSDYLLGLSDVKSVDPELQAVCEYTGLSENSAKLLHDYKIDIDILNFMLENYEIGGLRDIGSYLRFIKGHKKFLIDSLGNFEPFRTDGQIFEQVEEMERKAAPTGVYSIDTLDMDWVFEQLYTDDILSAISRLRGEYQREMGEHE